MKKVKTSLIGIAFLATVLLAGYFLFPAGINNLLRTEILNDQLFKLTNQQRIEHSLPELTENLQLKEAAQNKAEHMAQHGYFDHTDPLGRRFTHWIEESGYDYLYSGENLAVKFNTSEKVLEKWLESLSHRANLLGERYTDIGIGIAEGEYKGKQTVFVVQMYGQPKIAKNTFKQIKRGTVSTVNLILSKYKKKPVL